MHAYLVALEIEPVTVGKVYMALPLHCTVVHWFRSDATPAMVLSAITDVTLAQSPIEIVSGEPDMFGLNKDVPVNRIINEAEVQDFHIRLYDALQSLETTDVEPMWTRSGFTPHVTRQQSGRFEAGRRYVANKLYLVEALMSDELQQKQITSKLFLRGQS